MRGLAEVETSQTNQRKNKIQAEKGRLGQGAGRCRCEMVVDRTGFSSAFMAHPPLYHGHEFFWTEGSEALIPAQTMHRNTEQLNQGDFLKSVSAL